MSKIELYLHQDGDIELDLVDKDVWIYLNADQQQQLFQELAEMMFKRNGAWPMIEFKVPVKK